jgi:hypothetical protein
LNTGLVGMKCHTKQHNTRTIVAWVTSKGCGDDAHREQNKVVIMFVVGINPSLQDYCKNLIIVISFRCYENNWLFKLSLNSIDDG